MSTGYYTNIPKKCFKKSFVKVIRIFLKKRKTKNKNMVVNNIENFLK